MDDNPDLKQPVDTGNIGTIQELRVYTADELSPYGNRYNNPAEPNYNQPQYYQVSADGASFVVHESRVITLSGEPMPRVLQANGLYWQGRIAVERAYQTIVQYLNALGRVMDVLERKQQPVYSMLGLADMIANGLEADVQKRVDLVDEVRGVLNTVAVDKEDSYEILDLNLSGLPETVNLLKEQLSADTGMPITLLFGRSAAGLNATGESDFRNYYDMVQGIRNKQVRPALEQIIALLAVQKSLPDDVVDNWRIHFAPLFEPTAKEQADIDKVKADSLQAIANALTTIAGVGAISEQEVRDYLGDEGLFGLHEQGDSTAADDYVDKVGIT